MAGKVYFWKLRESMKAPYELRIKKLLKACKAGKHIQSGDLTAIKIHFGERGNTGFVSPLYVRPLVAFLKKLGSKPFLTDTNTLYVGERGESVSHCLQAASHGFDPNILQAPVIIADGIRSNNEREISFTGKHFQSFFIAGDILDADYLITVNHFKGHELAGFGGALKNLGMGCATRKGKMQQHCGMGPKVLEEKCKGCGECTHVCQANALKVDERGVIALDPERCVGCAACLLACKNGCLQVNWEVDVPVFLERMMEYAAAVLSQQKRPALHITFVMKVSPACDCLGFTDASLCPDIGVLASYDPVALDRACLDLVNAAPPLFPSRLPQTTKPGDDKFKAVHPAVRGEHALEYAQELGLGSMKYTLVEV